MNKLHKMYGSLRTVPIDYKKKRMANSWSKPINGTIYESFDKSVYKRSKLSFCEFIRDDSNNIDIHESEDSLIHSIRSDSNLVIDCIIPLDYLLDS